MRILHNPAVQTNPAPNANLEAGTATLRTGEPGPPGMGRGFSKLFSDIVCEQARQYMNSYPPRYDTPFRTVCERLARGEVLQEDTLGGYSDILCYRLSMNKLGSRDESDPARPMHRELLLPHSNHNKRAANQVAPPFLIIFTTGIALIVYPPPIRIHNNHK